MCARLRLQTKAEAEARAGTRADVGVMALMQSLPAARLETELELRLVEAPSSVEDEPEASEEEPDLEDWHEDPDGDASQPDEEPPGEFDTPESTLQDLSQRVDVLVDIGPDNQLLLTSGLSPVLLRLAGHSGLAQQFHLGLIARIEDSLKLAQAVVEANSHFFRKSGNPVKVKPDDLPGFKPQRLSALLKTLTLRTPWGKVMVLAEFIGRRSAAPNPDLELLQWLLEHLEHERERGVVAEAELATKLNLTTQGLGQKRKRLGIPSALQRKKQYALQPEDSTLLASWVTAQNAQELRRQLAQLIPQLRNERVRQLALLWKAEAEGYD